MKRRNLLGLSSSPIAFRARAELRRWPVEAIADCRCMWSGSFLRALGECQVTSRDEAPDPFSSAQWFKGLTDQGQVQVVGLTRYSTLAALHTLAAEIDYILAFHGEHRVIPSGRLQHRLSGSTPLIQALSETLQYHPDEWAYSLAKYAVAFDDISVPRSTFQLEAGLDPVAVSGQSRVSWVFVPAV